MEDENASEKERLAELRETGEAVGKLAQDEGAFGRVVEAFLAQNAEQFQTELSKLGLLPRCRLICRWLCSKHCVFICFKLCKEPARGELSVAEIREFARVTERLTADEALLKRFVDAVDRQDTTTFNKLLAESKWERFCHQVCHFLCFVRCRLVCKLLCPPPPLITEVAYIPTSQFTPGGPGLGLASGPSFPPGTTSPDNKPAGAGDHPIGGIANIRGVFVIANPFQYKVEFAQALAGPWTPIIQPIHDFRFNPGFPPPPLFLFYTRLPDPQGWYNVADMGLAGFDYLTDWQTPAGSNDQYYLKLTVRNPALTEFESLPVPVRVDNTPPTKPLIQLQLQTPDGKRRDLGCCDKVEQGKGNLVVITLQASDANFSRITVTLLGGCGASFDIIDTNGHSLSKTYNGNITDTGYPVPTTFLWDPWAAKIDPCCYLIDVRIWDRAIVDNFWAGGHGNENWQSITIA
ncbi:MAG TPA: hypothetical protein VEV41_26270 [Terriglobales bacterium]|jgi:hypothetical protein|nr:hypothetical protein [Terriglobales bacterium]